MEFFKLYHFYSYLLSYLPKVLEGLNYHFKLPNELENEIICWKYLHLRLFQAEILQNPFCLIDTSY